MVVSDKNIRVYVTMSRHTHELLKKEAEREDRNVSNMVNVIIKKHLKLDTNSPLPDKR